MNENKTDGNKQNMSTFKADDILIKEGIVCNEMYKIVSGKAALYTNYGKDNEYLIGIISENACFGDISMFTGTPNPYTVIAFTDMLVYRIKADNFESFIKNNSKNAWEIMKNMARQNLSLRKNIEMITNELDNIIDDNKKVADLANRIAKVRAASINGITYTT